MSYVSLHIDSEYLGANTNITVILPEKKGEETPEEFYTSGRKYKVLWLFHGGHGDSTDWIRKTKIELYACEKDLVVVCPSAQSSFYQDWPEFGPGYYMKDFFFRELMPLIYGWFPVSSKKEDNYIAGLSMGGVGTLTFVLEQPQRFSAAAVLSGTPFDLQKTEGGTPNMVKVYRNLAKVYGGREIMLASGANIWEAFAGGEAEKMPRLYFSCGRQDSGYANYLAYIAYLEEKGFSFVHDESTDYGHEWREWDYQIEKVIGFFME